MIDESYLKKANHTHKQAQGTMLKPFIQSLPVRAWTAVITIVTLAILSASASGLLSWISKDDAAAINAAGSVRMATFRINYQVSTDFKYLQKNDNALLLPFEDDTVESRIQLKNDGTNKQEVINLLISDMEQRLAKLQTYQSTTAHKDSVLDDKLNDILAQWENSLKPQLLALNVQDVYLISTNFVIKVDDYVKSLQQRNEERQSWLQRIQAFSLLITIIIIFAGMYELQQNVLHPVEQLIHANKKFKDGQLNTRVDIAGYEEFNDLGLSFNDMATTIESNQQNLASQIQIKTKDLVQMNNALSILFDFAKKMATESITLDMLEELIERFGKILPENEIVLCLKNDFIELDDSKDSISLHQGGMHEICTKNNCSTCTLKNNKQTSIYPIHQQQTTYGELLIHHEQYKSIEPIHRIPSVDESIIQSNKSIQTHNGTTLQNQAQVVLKQLLPDAQLSSISDEAINKDELINVLSNLIGTSLSLRKNRQQDYQILLMEERNTIARELHDSLAQSLSYLKIQISILEKTMSSETNNSPNEQQQIIDQVKTGLNSAYIQLRELLTTFRLQMNTKNFDEALNAAANEFANKGNFNVNLTNKVLSSHLDANEQIHLLQIARECLSNVHRHACANTVNLKLVYNKKTSEITLSVTDDGVGLNPDFNKSQHHGLVIMQERAKNLNGVLNIQQYKPKGTRVSINFIPSFFKHI